MGKWKNTHYHIALGTNHSFATLESAIQTALVKTGYQITENEVPTAESALLRAAGEGSLNGDAIKGEAVEVLGAKSVQIVHDPGDEDHEASGVRQSTNVTLTIPLSRLGTFSDIVVDAHVRGEVGVYPFEEHITVEKLKQFPYVHKDMEAFEAALLAAL